MMQSIVSVSYVQQFLVSAVYSEVTSALIHESREIDSFTVSILMEFYLRINFLLGM